VCINKYIYDSFISNDEISPKCKLIPTIFDANFKIFDIKKKYSDYFTVFYCANTTTLKGLQYLLPAFNIFQKNKSNVQLYIGGTIDKGIFNLISKYLNHNILLLGSLNSFQIAEQLKQTSVFVLPSLTDAGPVTMIEAMYSKTPVICSDGVGNQWLIKEGFNGYLYERYSIDQLVDKLERCYNNIEELQIVGENARKTIDNAIINKQEFYGKFEELIIQ
jgi:glycosyltransferase involved in cell wall biosynthesis